MAKKPPSSQAATPVGKQLTGRQFGRASALSATTELLGWGDSPTGEYRTYREMRECPTVAIARAAATAPVKAAGWSIKSTDDTGRFDDAVKFVQGVMETHYKDIVKQALYAWDYGWQSGEIVWEVKDGMITLAKVNFLKPDDTKVLTDELGNVVGLKQKDVEVPQSKVFLYTYDGECGNPYGRSRNENIRCNAWHPWKESIRKYGQYCSKHAGVIPIIRYPLGESERGLTGEKTENEIIASNLLQYAGKGAGMAFPVKVETWQANAINAAAGGIKFDELCWKIEYLESKAGAGSEMLAGLAYFDKLICRGWLVPERAILEGQHGTKAEAGEHGDVAVAIAEEENTAIAKAVQDQIVYPMVLANFGQEAADAVSLQASPLSKPEKQLAARIIETVFTNPANGDLLLTMLDLDAMLDHAGLPKTKEVTDQTQTRGAGEVGQPVDPSAVTSQVMQEPGPVQDQVKATALNGAQVQSMVELATQVANRQLPADVVKAIMRAAFPAIEEAVINQIIDGLRKFKPPTDEQLSGPLSRAFAASAKRLRDGRWLEP